MEILVTIIAFWLILVGAYGAFSLRQERGREQAPKVRPQRTSGLATSPAGATAGPFAPVSLPAERVPSFITRAAPLRVEPLPPAHAGARSEVEAPDRFRAEKVVAARLQQQSATATYDAPRARRSEEPSYDEPRYQQPHVGVAPSPQDAEVDFLRAQVEHLRSEVYALSADKPARSERPQQRRYRTGNYTHLPRTLRRQVNEVRGFRRFFSRK